jgi:hypothetical protein
MPIFDKALRRKLLEECDGNVIEVVDRTTAFFDVHVPRHRWFCPDIARDYKN